MSPMPNPATVGLSVNAQIQPTDNFSPPTVETHCTFIC
jgi:hypothetical protein